MTFSGRGFRNPVVTYTATAQAITVDVNCEDNCAAWSETTFIRKDLVRMLAMIDAVRAEEGFPATPEVGDEA